MKQMLYRKLHLKEKKVKWKMKEDNLKKISTNGMQRIGVRTRNK
jgi:hypothetical protein